MAQRLGLSERTLQRRLEASDRAFNELVDRTRQSLAKGFLRNPNLSLVQIALNLGYSEQTAFTRAFKRWTKSTPHVYRKYQFCLVPPAP